MTELVDLVKLRAEVRKKIQALTEREKDLTKQIQARCKHQWQWRAVAGEGQFCVLCGADNPDCDD